jgi:thymidine phosphorylase
MNAPLGRAVGNALEVRESIDCLRGGGPADLLEVSLELAAEMLVIGGVATDLAAARDRCRRVIADGSALERFRRVVAAQGGDPAVCDDPAGVLPRPRAVEPYRIDRPGWITRMLAWPVGQASMLLGAGRARVDAAIDPAAGIVLHRQVGEKVAAGDVIAELHYDPRTADVRGALATFDTAITVAAEPPPPRRLILDRL